MLESFSILCVFTYTCIAVCITVWHITFRCTVVPLFYTLYFKTTLDYETACFGPKGQFSLLNDLYFKTTCNIKPHFLGPMGGLKIEGPLYVCRLDPLILMICVYLWSVPNHRGCFTVHVCQTFIVQYYSLQINPEFSQKKFQLVSGKVQQRRL